MALLIRTYSNRINNTPIGPTIDSNNLNNSTVIPDYDLTPKLPVNNLPESNHTYPPYPPLGWNSFKPGTSIFNSTAWTMNK